MGDFPWPSQKSRKYVRLMILLRTGVGINIRPTCVLTLADRVETAMDFSSSSGGLGGGQSSMSNEQIMSTLKQQMELEHLQKRIQVIWVLNIACIT